MIKPIKYFLDDSNEKKIEIIINQLEYYNNGDSFLEISEMLDIVRTLFNRDLGEIINLLKDVKKDLENNE